MLGSGSLGLITFPGPPRRLRRDEIDARHPALLPGLVSHPHIGFVLVATADGSLVMGPSGQRNLATGEVVGDDPLAPFGGRAVDQVAMVDAYATVADVMVNARYDVERDEVAAFESQVGSHGGLGGPQTRPFLLYPADLSDPAAPIFTSVAVHRVLKTWLAEVGQPVVLPWLDEAAGGARVLARELVAVNYVAFGDVDAVVDTLNGFGGRERAHGRDHCGAGGRHEEGRDERRSRPSRTSSSEIRAGRSSSTTTAGRAVASKGCCWLTGRRRTGCASSASTDQGSDSRVRSSTAPTRDGPTISWPSPMRSAISSSV